MFTDFLIHMILQHTNIHRFEEPDDRERLLNRRETLSIFFFDAFQYLLNAGLGFPECDDNFLLMRFHIISQDNYYIRIPMV